jgi:hypothetical protein
VRNEVIAILVAALVVSAFMASSILNPTKTSPAGTSASGVYQVLAQNLTIYGKPANLPCTWLNQTECQPVSTASLSGVELVGYGLKHYYVYSMEADNGEARNGSQPVPTTLYTTWFTNSSIYCISPAHPLTNTNIQFPTCPTQPYQQVAFTLPAGSASKVDPANGLRLGLALAVNSSGGLEILVDESNTLNSTNDVPAKDAWPAAPQDFFLWVQDGCGAGMDLPIGYEVLQGIYGEGNFTTATPLTLDAQPVTTCPSPMPTQSYGFKAASDIALTSAYSTPVDYPLNTTCDWTKGLPCWWSGLGTWSGYWTGATQQVFAGAIIGGPCPGPTEAYNCPLTFTVFPPGGYTVVAADEWGEVLFLHYEVTK